MLERNDNKNQKVWQIIMWILFAIIFVVDVIFIIKCAIRFADSDLASEMMLGKLLSDERKMITTSWYYSTELQVLHMAHVMAVIFWFTGSWVKVRIITDVIMVIIYCLSIYYFSYCYKANNSYPLRKYAPLIMALLLLPHSFVYSNVTIIGMYYYAYLIITFFVLGLFFRYLDLKDANRIVRSRVILAVLLLLSLATGLCGLREICLLFTPLLITSFVFRKNDKRKFRLSVIIMFFVGAGYVINLALKYFDILSYSTYTHTRLKLQNFEYVKKVYLDMVYAFATDKCRWVGIFITVVAIISIIYVAKLRKELSEESFLIVHFLIALFIYICIYTFTDMEYVSRYSIPFIILIFPIMFLACSLISNSRIRISIMILFLAVVLGHNIYAYKECTPVRNDKFDEVVDVLLEEGVYQGYASYWNGNILTYLTDGKIDVWGYAELKYCTRPLFSTDNVMTFLQKVEHTKTIPQGRKFLLLNKSELVGAYVGYFPDENIVLETDKVVLYIFDEDQEY